jgi:hypothetical protein
MLDIEEHSPSLPARGEIHAWEGYSLSLARRINRDDHR